MARKKKSPEAPPPGNFVVSFTGLILIMLCFFIFLFANSTVSQVKVHKAVGTMIGAFNIFGDGMGLEDRGRSWDSKVKDLELRDEQELKAFTRVEQLIQRANLPPEVFATKGPDGYTISLGDAVFFESNSTTLTPVIFPFLDQIAEIISKGNVQVKVGGHTDDVDPKAGQTNWEISAARALAVLRYLEGSGVPSGLLLAEGFAGYKPLVPNTSLINRSRNRRVDLVIKREPWDDTIIPVFRSQGKQ